MCYYRVPCNSLTRIDICCRMLFHSQCTLDPDRKGSFRNTRSELHGHCKSYTLQMMGNVRQGTGSSPVNGKLKELCHHIRFSDVKSIVALKESFRE